MTLLLIGLIFSMLIYAWRIFGWIRASILWFKNPNGKTAEALQLLGQKQWAFTFGGIEHLIIFASLLAATLILY